MEPDQSWYAVIMAGGRGERFWPQSRLDRPKHLLPIVGREPMLRQTVDRILPLIPAERVIIITNAEQREAVANCCDHLPDRNIVAEPVGRDTAPAVALAMALVKQRDPGGRFAILPADHVIHDEDEFRRVVARALKAAAEEDGIVTIGVQPTSPATGYGYIHRGEALAEVEGETVFAVKSFKEKPDLDTARRYLDSGEYYWNAGMFFWSVSTIERALERCAPELHEGMAKVEHGLQAGEDLTSLLAAVYPSLVKISIDFAVLEKAETVRVIPASFDWDDVGEWPAVARHCDADADGNVARGLALLEKSSNSLVVSSEDHLVAVLGVEDLIVVHTADATLVCPKGKAQAIKEMVRKIAGQEDLKHLV